MSSSSSSSCCWMPDSEDEGEGDGEGLEGEDVRVALRGHCLETYLT